ncbi:MAG: hypothetical protein AAGB51_08125 [Planctomycetota bacterium]
MAKRTKKSDPDETTENKPEKAKKPKTETSVLVPIRGRVLRHDSVVLWFALFAGLTPIGVLTFISGASHRALVEDSGAQSGPGFAMVIGALIVIGAIAALSLALRNMSEVPSPATDHDHEQNMLVFQRYLVGIGYALLLSSLVLVGLVATLISLGALQPKPDAPTPTETLMGSDAAADPLMGEATESVVQLPVKLSEHGSVALLVGMSAVASIVGALFFVANSLRRKRDNNIHFSAELFWGGLWFRLGEAVLFSMVLFWLIWTQHRSSSNGSFALDYYWLPVLSLLLGMFVTAGERIIYSIAQGLFRGISAFFDPEKVKDDEDTLERKVGEPTRQGKDKP